MAIDRSISNALAAAGASASQVAAAQAAESSYQSSRPGSTFSGGKEYTNSSVGGSSAPVTDMSQWYRDTKAATGSNPTADMVKAAMASYKDYVGGKANAGSGNIYNTYGEQIGNTGTGTGGYTDMSKEAANAIVNPSFVRNANQAYTQRYLTSTNGSEPGFLNKSTLPSLASNYLKNNPGSGLGTQGLTDLWDFKYGNVNSIPSLMEKYTSEFGGNTGTNNNLLPAGIATSGDLAAQQTKNDLNSLTLRDYAARNNLAINYDPATNQVTLGDQSFTSGLIPGTTFKNGTNYVTDPTALLAALTPTASQTNLAGQQVKGTQMNQDVMDLMEQLGLTQQITIPEMPTYVPVNNTYSIQAPILPALTSDPSQTSFVPTLAFKEKQLAAQQATNDEAYRNYQTQLAAWQTQVENARNEQNRRLQLAQTLLPYSELTAAQQAELDQAKATATLKQGTTSYDQAMDRWNAAGYVISDADAEVLGVPKGTPTNDASYKAASLAKKGSSGGGGGGKTLTPYQMWQIQQAEDKKPSAETTAMKEYLTKFKDGANARAYLQKFGNQGDVDIASLSSWGKTYFGDSWFMDPTVSFDKYGKAVSIK